MDDVSGEDNSGDERIVILSTDHKHEAQPWWNGNEKTDWPAFSYWFFKKCFNNYYNLGAAFNYAVDKVWQNNQHYGWLHKQYPWLDDNGDGEAHGGHPGDKHIPSHGDGYLAFQTYL